MRVAEVRASIHASRRRPVSWLDRYGTVFGLLMMGAVVAQPVFTALAAAARQADPARIGPGVALLTLGYAAYLAAARLIGPVAVPAADAAWLLLSPLPRRAVLGRTAVILLAVAVAGGLVFGVGLLAVLGGADRFALRLVTALVLGVSATVGGMAVAVLAQASPSWDSWLGVGLVLLVVAASVAALLATGPGRHLMAVVATAPASAGAAVAGAAATVTALLVRRAWGALSRMPARAVLAASTRTGRLADAAVAVDPGALTWIAEDNHWRARNLSSRPWPSLPAPFALAWQEWRRLARRPGRLAAMLGSAVLPAVTAQAVGGMTTPVVVVTFAGGLAVAAGAVSGARRESDDASLVRLFGPGFREVLAARAVLPALLGAGWLVLALGALGLTGVLPAGPWWLFGPTAAPGLAAAALRTARRPPIDHAMPVIETPGGAIPTGPLIWGMTGVDVALLATSPMLAAFAAWPETLGPYLVAQAVLGAGVLIGYLARATR
ncbi:DUF6297 family protein [Streptosporangium sp. NPDC051022]|uniref:DUF6297 family protein n=1 Tax=Streptosporangium sp. NPDC051022 TaxID=3155752 RepID=UPI0034159EBE